MWNRNQIVLHAPPLDTWPSVTEDALDSDEKKEKFGAQKKAIQLYFSGEPTQSIQKLTGVWFSDLSRLAKKCLTLASDGRIFGFRALIPYYRISPYVRTKSTSHKRAHQQGGQAGVLIAILIRFPNLEDELVKRIRQDAKLREIPEYRMKAVSLHRLFINLLKQKGVASSEWPFNTQYLGMRSIQKYMAAVLNRNFARSVNTREEKDAKAHLPVGTGHSTFLVFEEPYDAVEIDAYNIEAHLSVAFRTPEGTEVDLLLQRLWLLAAVDRGSSAVLAYSLVYRSEATADDVVQLIRDAVTKKWTPKELTIPGLRYPSSGGLPSGVLDAGYGAAWSVTMLDGALAHLAEKIRERVRKTVGFVINWGAPGHFERRPNVERTFKQIGQDLIRRLPSTTGSHPFNGRAPKAEQKAVQYKIRATDIEELLDVYMAQHNATPNEGLSHLSPLEYMRHYLDGTDPISHARHLPKSDLDKAKGFSCIEKKWVRGGRESGRRPYIQIDRIRYTSPVLADAGHLIGKPVIVEIDEEDMRQVRVFLENGAEIGYLKAHGKWSVTKHSRKTRRAINSLLHKRTLVLSEACDPVQVYLAHLSTPEKRFAGKTFSLNTRKATDATRIAREAGAVPQINLPASPVDVQAKAVPSVNDVAKRKSLLTR